MAAFYDHITDGLRQFIEKQHIFFVATAPLDSDGHVNLSPKGLDCFRVLNPNRVCYLDLTGSGNETSAHILENKRVTFMFCAFEGPPTILRLYGRGTVILPGDAEWDDLIGLFPTYLGTRQIIAADVYQVQTSCGYAVPRFTFDGDRDTLHRWCEHHGADGLVKYRAEKNAASLDGLPTPIGLKHKRTRQA